MGDVNHILRPLRTSQLEVLPLSVELCFHRNDPNQEPSCLRHGYTRLLPPSAPSSVNPTITIFYRPSPGPSPPMSLEHGALRVGSFTGSVGGLALGGSVCLDTFRTIRRVVCMAISDCIGLTVHTYVSCLVRNVAGVRCPRSLP
jgi:hypothetical protein